MRLTPKALAMKTSTKHNSTLSKFQKHCFNSLKMETQFMTRPQTS